MSAATISPLAGKPAPQALLVDVPKLLAAYFDLRPDPTLQSQRVVFGTSGHRGSSLARSFNEWHVLAISQAICEYRISKDIDGPLYLGIDTHALSQPAFETTLEVLAANSVRTMIAKGGEFTPTPAVSHAILGYNRGRSSGLADGIVITPSHNPPDSGGFKYNPPNGGPADKDITGWIEARANECLESGLQGVQRIPYEKARQVLIEMEKQRKENKVEQVYLFHNRPKPEAIYAPISQRLLPLDDAWRRDLMSIRWPTDSLPEVLNGGERTLLAFVREYLFVSLFRACAESLASENASRLAAMQRAEQNIDELLEDLNRTFHRLRQSGIDEELFDVASGFEALTAL